MRELLDSPWQTLRMRLLLNNTNKLKKKLARFHHTAFDLSCERGQNDELHSSEDITRFAFVSTFSRSASFASTSAAAA